MEKIFISEPCKESWNKMHPLTEGRFCDSCSLTVVDFTKMSNEEISAYFLKKGNENACGRYRNDQVSTPKLVRRRKRWGWLITILALVFGSSFISSCRKHTMSNHTQGRKVRSFFAPESQKSTEQHAKDFHH